MMILYDTLINTKVNATSSLLSIKQRQSHDFQPSFYPLSSPSLLIKRQFGPCIKRIKKWLHGGKARAAGNEEVITIVGRDAWDSWGCEGKEARRKKDVTIIYVCMSQ